MTIAVLAGDGLIRKIRFLAAVYSFFALGCATTTGQRSIRAMHEGNYGLAIELLELQVVDTQVDAKAWARLGEAYFHLKQDSAARSAFRKALEVDSTISGLHMFLGFIEEDAGRIDRAVTHYRGEIANHPHSAFANALAQRESLLRTEHDRNYARLRLAESDSSSQIQGPRAQLVVLPFADDSLSEGLRPLALGLAQALSTDLAKVEYPSVAEFSRVAVIAKEIRRIRSEITDSLLAREVGAAFGADQVISGVASESPQGQLVLKPVIVTVKTGTIQPLKTQSGEFAQFFQIQKRVLRDAINELNIRPSDSEKSALDRTPTESFVSFLAFSRGLAHEIHGDYQRARQEYQRAAANDPLFTEATLRAHAVSHLASLEPRPQVMRLDRFVSRYGGFAGWAEKPLRTDERLSSMLNSSGLIRPLGDNPETPPAGSGATVIVHGRFDGEP